MTKGEADALEEEERKPIEGKLLGEKGFDEAPGRKARKARRAGTAKEDGEEGEEGEESEEGEKVRKARRRGR